MIDVDRDEYHIDIHHIFSQKWCDDHGIPPRVYNSIINKTPISYKANRMIGGRAPSEYLAQLQNHSSVQISTEEQDAILRSHLINPTLLRANDFGAFFEDRKSELLQMIQSTMGKAAVVGEESPAEDAAEEPDYSELSVA